MASREFDIDGLKEMGRNLDMLDRATAERALDAALEGGGEVIREEVARLTPRSDTSGGTTGKGHAADHIGTKLEAHERHRRDIKIGPESSFWYLIFPELGTPNQPAVAMFRRAADTRFKQATEAFRDVLALKIRGALK